MWFSSCPECIIVRPPFTSGFDEVSPSIGVVSVPIPESVRDLGIIIDQRTLIGEVVQRPPGGCYRSLLQGAQLRDPSFNDSDLSDPAGCWWISLAARTST